MSGPGELQVLTTVRHELAATAAAAAASRTVMMRSADELEEAIRPASAVGVRKPAPGRNKRMSLKVFGRSVSAPGDIDAVWPVSGAAAGGVGDGCGGGHDAGGSPLPPSADSPCSSPVDSPHHRRLRVAGIRSWLPAAIPMNNPYCSCKLTRQHNSLHDELGRSASKKSAPEDGAPSEPPSPHRFPPIPFQCSESLDEAAEPEPDPEKQQQQVRGRG